MSFSFNENLRMEDSTFVVESLSNMENQDIDNAIKKVARKEVTMVRLIEEFIIQFQDFDVSKEVTGEHIKSYFVIVLNGVKKVLMEIAKKNHLLVRYAQEDLYENVFTYIDDRIDGLDFDDLFKTELSMLNNK